MDWEFKSVRYCVECNRLYFVEEGDFWVELSMLGFKIIYFVLMDGKVYDIIEWVGCQCVGIFLDIYRVFYYILFGFWILGIRGWQRVILDVFFVDFQDFLSWIF